jgi:hypothetical protein
MSHLNQNQADALNQPNELRCFNLINSFNDAFIADLDRLNKKHLSNQTPFIFEDFQISEDFNIFFDHLPLHFKSHLPITDYFWQHFQGKHSTTELFKDDRFRIELLNPNDDLALISNISNISNTPNLDPINHDHLQWQRKTLIYINDIPFMYAHAQTKYPSYCEAYFNLMPIEKSLGHHIHKPHIKRSDFLFIHSKQLMPINNSIEPSMQLIGRYSQFIWQGDILIDSKPSPLHLFEYFIISDDLIHLLEKKQIKASFF